MQCKHRQCAGTTRAWSRPTDAGLTCSRAHRQTGETPLLLASLQGEDEIVRLLLEHGADPDQKDSHEGATALMAASGRGFVGVVQTLLERGANVNAVANVRRYAP